MDKIEFVATLNGVKANVESLIDFANTIPTFDHVAKGSQDVIRDVRQTLFTLGKELNAKYEDGEV
jgi:hypothetical protein